MSQHRLPWLAAAVALAAALAAALDLLNVAPGAGGRLLPLLIAAGVLVCARSATRLARALETKPANMRDLQTAAALADGADAVVSEADGRRQIRWHGLVLRSNSELKIAKELERRGALFMTGARIRLKTESGLQTREVDFLAFYAGRWGILEVDGPHHVHSQAADAWRDARFREHGILVVRYPSAECYQNPRGVVDAFLSGLEASAEATDT